MNTGLMSKFLGRRGVAAIVSGLLATVVSWSMLAGVALAAATVTTAPTHSRGRRRRGRP